MKKKLITSVLAVLMVAGAMFALSACTKTELSSGTATYGSVGMEKHSYFPYATVTVDGEGKVTAVELNEAFGPTGKLWAETSTAAATVAGTTITVGNTTIAYNNPWYKNGSTTVSSIAQDMYTKATLAERQTAVNDKYYISIAGEIFKMTVKNIVCGHLRIDALVFVAKNDANKVLTDEYLAGNIKWYVDAIKANTVFACDANGTKLTDWTPADGAFLKGDDASTYYPTRGLNGANFKKAMGELSAFAISKNCEFEYVYAAGGNFEGKRVKDLVLSVPGDGTTQASSLNADTYLNYAASYLEHAVIAKEMAMAARTLG